MQTQTDASPATASSFEQDLLLKTLAHAATVLGEDQLSALLDRCLTPQACTGLVVVTNAEFSICSTSLGQVFVPHSLLAKNHEVTEGACFDLMVLPAQRRRTTWRALSAEPAGDGWTVSAHAHRKKARAGRELHGAGQSERSSVRKQLSTQGGVRTPPLQKRC